MPISLYQEPKLQFEVSRKGQDGKTRTLRTDAYFLYQLFRKLYNGYSPTIGICGNQRVGKSFIGVWLSMMVCKFNGVTYNPEETTFYEPEKALERLNKSTHEPYLIDEASDVLDKTEWHLQTHKALSSMINTQAYKYNCYIFVSPFVFIDLNKRFPKHFDFLLRVDDRGRFKAWKMIKRYDEYNPNRAFRRFFLDDLGIRLSQVPKEIWERYKKYSEEQKTLLREKRRKLSINKKGDITDPIERLRLRLR